MPPEPKAKTAGAIGMATTNPKVLIQYAMAIRTIMAKPSQ